MRDVQARSYARQDTLCPVSQDHPNYRDVLTYNTGQQIPTQLWESGQRRFQELLAQTNHLADKLESQGIKAREERTDIIVIGEVTGCIAEQSDFRPIRFLPVVAQRERQGMLNALIYFQRNAKGGSYMRYGVVTAGQRIPACGPLRTVITKLGRDISRWASEAMKIYQIEIVYRGTEFTVDATGTYHPHANILYIPRRKLTDDEWSKYLAWTRRRLGAHWQDCGKLIDAREALKYPFKPTDLDGPPAEEIAWLFHELFRMKLAQPLGAFKAFWKELETDKEKIGRVYGPNNQAGSLQRIRKQEREYVKPSNTPPIHEENKIICRTAPQARFTPFMEPLVLVKNFTEHPKTGLGKQRLGFIRGWQNESQANWENNGAPDQVTMQSRD